MTKQEKLHQIRSLLKTILDPELPVNIFDLGLIYGVYISKNQVTITYTLTSVNCPGIEIIPQQIEQLLENLSWVELVNLQLTWQPTWNKSLISEEARVELGLD